MRHYGLIGEKLGHSLSRPIHEAIFAHAGIDADYRIIEIPRDRFTQEAEGLLASLDGFNITIPYKQDIMPLLDAVDPLADAIGAVNTVVCGEKRGFNTDAAGFMGMLQHYGIDVAGAPHCFILGSGGTMKTVRACLKEMGAKGVTVVSRHPGAAPEVGQGPTNAGHCSQCPSVASAASTVMAGVDEISYADFYERFPQIGGLIVNASAAGMWPRKDPDNICAIHPDRVDEMMRYATGVADVVYNPPQTFLTQAAAKAGKPWCTGLYMLVAQAVEAEAIWQDRKMPAGLVEKIMQEVHL